MRKFLIAILFSLICLSVYTPVVYAHNELQGGRYFTLINEKDEVIHRTAHQVSTGDIYITADNARYKVVKLEGFQAFCEYEGKEKLSRPWNRKGILGFDLFRHAVPAAQNKKQPTIAIYHTHSDESYVPSDGKESIRGNGGIYDVGQTLTVQLKKMGFNVVHSDNRHDPHDVNAYHRSRKTAVNLLQKGPDAIIDVHRDAVPADVYKTNLKGEDVTKVKLVLGRQNPNMKSNLEFAKSLKAAMDKQTPGLSNGIYIGKGDYNQDLSPRSVLVEVGAHTNSKEEAQKGVAMFAQTLPEVFGVNTAAAGTRQEPARKPLEQNNQRAGSILITLLLVAGLAGGAYYLINRNTLK
ncbi:MAG TPA: stage II sporulation protein P [Syntrophomonadaceae bacterium]|nr:stage II sporulation protein P [Syntrophomonadaceae bacterium]